MGPLRVVTTCCIAALALLVLCVPPASAFNDVPDSHRYARAINELAQLGIVSGKGDGTFGPNDPVYRAQFAKMICGLLQIDVSEDQTFAPFVDLGPDDLGDLYPHEFVGAAYRAGITKGQTTTTFSPYTNITLAQVMTMVVRAADAYYPGLLAPPPTDWYASWPAADSVHGANVRRADYTDLLASLPIADRWSDVFRPATRGEVSQILANLRHRHTEVPPSLYLEGTKLDLTAPLYVESNRYYIPLGALVAAMNGSFTLSNGAANLQVQNLRIVMNTTTGEYTVNDVSSHVRHAPKISDGELLVSLFDLEKLLGLEVVWDEYNMAIRLFFERYPISKTEQPTHGKRALVRFEDITASQRYSTAESLAYLRVVFDYCYSKSIPMHLGWVPRYIDPSKGIDNAPAEDYSMHNANFVYTLDYFLDRDGLVGLHGYTHQYGNQVSLSGTEFDSTHNTTESSISQRVKYALDDARDLDIPVSFFESPHYAALFSQQRVLGKYFDILYEPKVSVNETKITRIFVGNRTVTFVPTPLGYMVGPGDEYNMITRMKALGSNALASFFYHPDIEFGFIRIELGGDGYPSYAYADSSPLHRVINAFIGEGYRFVRVDAL